MEDDAKRCEVAIEELEKDFDAIQTVRPHVREGAGPWVDLTEQLSTQTKLGTYRAIVAKLRGNEGA